MLRNDGDCGLDERMCLLNNFLTGRDGDDTTMNNHGDDNARETNAAKSKKTMKPSDREIATREASFHCDRCRACVGGAGWSDAHKRQREEQNGLLMACTMVSSLMDKNEHRKVSARSPREANLFLVVNFKLNTVIWSILVK